MWFIFSGSWFVVTLFQHLHWAPWSGSPSTDCPASKVQGFVSSPPSGSPAYFPLWFACIIAIMVKSVSRIITVEQLSSLQRSATKVVWCRCSLFQSILDQLVKCFSQHNPDVTMFWQFVDRYNVSCDDAITSFFSAALYLRLAFVYVLPWKLKVPINDIF